MGRLVNGTWMADPPPVTGDGFQRPPTTFRDTISADGSSGFPAEPGRYHLYVSYACPWAHRVLIFRKLKKLEDIIPLSVVNPVLGEDGWEFGGFPGATPDRVEGARFLRELYVAARSDYTGRVSVPALWDRKTGTFVNNESLDLCRMLDAAFDTISDDSGNPSGNPSGDPAVRFFPDDGRDQVEAMIEANHWAINRGVYQCGFAPTQDAYEEAVGKLFARLDECERILGRQRYLCGDRITAADWCLFATLYRFDTVYYVLFLCNRRRLVDYPNLWAYARDLYQVPGVAETCHMLHVRNHYFRSFPRIRPRGIVPVGPSIDFGAPHHRDALGPDQRAGAVSPVVASSGAASSSSAAASSGAGPSH